MPRKRPRDSPQGESGKTPLFRYMLAVHHGLAWPVRWRGHRGGIPSLSTHRSIPIGQCKGTGKVPRNFLRHYYDIHQLLDVEAVQKFIGTPEYLAHKKKRFTSLNLNVAESGAFTIDDEKVRKQFEAEYSKTAPLYYRGQIPLDKILARIQRDLARL